MWIFILIPDGSETRKVAQMGIDLNFIIDLALIRFALA